MSLKLGLVFLKDKEIKLSLTSVASRVKEIPRRQPTPTFTTPLPLLNFHLHEPQYITHLLSSRCMNQLLFDRSTGTLSPQAFARIQTSQRLQSIEPAPRLRFDGGEKETVAATSSENGESQATAEVPRKIWAHQAGVNALSLDIDNRL